MLKPEEYHIKTALISVSDKNGIVDFAKNLTSLGIKIFSTGGTARLLHENGIEVVKVSDLTGFPEILDGRVKTLHPAVHAGLLARLDKEEHVQQLKDNGLQSIDLLVVNLYPFEETLAKNDSTHEDIIENIDIGGPGMLRAAAKNYLWTAPVVNPDKYGEIIDRLKQNDCTLDTKYRLELAAEVFSHTAYYDGVISGYLRDYTNIKNLPAIAIPLKKEQELRYGENPHQSAALYGSFHSVFTQLHGKELSYNNIIDMDAAAKLILEFEGEPAVGLIKHTNPCGAAVGVNIPDAFNKALATDTVSPYGGIIVTNLPVDVVAAEAIHGMFTEVIIAPEFSDDALELLRKKKNRRLIIADFEAVKNYLSNDYRSVTAGFLMQGTDKILINENNLRIVTKRKPTEEEMASLMFGWKIVKHVKSNAIVYSAHDRTLGIGAGQMSRVDSSRIAVEKSKLMGLSLKGSTMASDAYFPFADGVEEAAAAGATAVIQPGGSIRDEEVIAAADANNMAMIFTGMRHFRH